MVLGLSYICTCETPILELFYDPASIANAIIHIAAITIIRNKCLSQDSYFAVNLIVCKYS